MSLFALRPAPSVRCGLIALLALLGTSCKKEESRPPTLGDDAAPGASKATTAEGEDNGASGDSDLYGDPLPAMARARFGSLRMIDRDVRNMIFGREGATVISTHKRGYQIWNLQDGGRERVLEQDDAGRLMALSPNGTLLATVNEEGRELHLWNLDSNADASKVKSKERIIGLCFDSDTHVSAATESGGIVTWSTENEDPKRIAGTWRGATAFACAPKAGWYAVGTKDGRAYAIDREKKAVIELGASQEEITAAAISSDGKSFVFGSRDEYMHIWNKAETAPSLQVQAHDYRVTALAFSPDNKKLYSAGGDSWFRVWNPDNGEMLEEIPGIGGLASQFMRISPSGKQLISWSQHGNERGSEAGRWWLWNAETGALLLEPERHRKAVTAVEFSPDGKLLASAGEDRHVRIWDAASGKNLALLDAAQGAVHDLHFANSSELWTSGEDALLRVWQWQKERDKTPVEAIGGAVNRFALSPDAKRAYTGDQIGRVWSWDLKTGNRIQAYDKQGYSAIYDVRLSPNGELLAIAGTDALIRVSNLKTGKEVAKLNPGDSKSNFALAFSPDGKWLASGGDSHAITLWKTEDWSLAKSFPAHDGTVRCLEFTPGGRYLVSGGNDEIVRVWDLQDKGATAEFEGHTGVISDVAVSPDGRTVASASHDRTVLLWQLPTADAGANAEAKTETPEAAANAVEPAPQGGEAVADAGPKAEPATKKTPAADAN